jgi:hypothetical protein
VQPSARDLAYRAVAGYLQTNDPDEAADLDLVFADVYSAIERRMHTPDAASAAEADGLGFDTGFLAGTAITIATQVAFVITRAALKDSIQRDSPGALDHVEGKLIAWTGKAKLVSEIRKRVEGILKNL